MQRYCIVTPLSSSVFSRFLFQLHVAIVCPMHFRVSQTESKVGSFVANIYLRFIRLAFYSISSFSLSSYLNLRISFILFYSLKFVLWCLFLPYSPFPLYGTFSMIKFVFSSRSVYMIFCARYLLVDR